MAPPQQHALSWPAEVMNVAQVALTVHLHPKTVRQEIRRGLLPARNMSTTKRPEYRIEAHDAQRWWDERLVRPGRNDGVDALVTSGQARLMRRGRIDRDRAVLS